ncbi:MAG: family 20 glycosylhydrolase [Clostridia bacterium]
MYPPIFPTPEQMIQSEGAYHFGAGVMGRIHPTSLCPEQQTLLVSLFHQFACTASTLSLLTDAALPDFTAVLGSCAIPELPQTADYTVHVTTQGVALRGRNVSGLLHAFYSLLQCIRPETLTDDTTDLAIPCLQIVDRPALAFRGIHLCVFPETRLLQLEKAIRLAGICKFSHVVLEFWGTLRYDKMPELAWPDHSYEKAQLRPLVALAQNLGMQVVPMFNHLGHATQSRSMYGRHVMLHQNPRRALLFEPDGWTWCLSNPDTHKLLRAIREELMALCGPSDAFHLGCDEAYSYASCPRCQAQDHIALLSNYLNGLTAELAAQGRRAIIWGDALLDQTQWHAPHIATSRPDQRTHEALPALDRRLVIADWQYDIESGDVPTSAYFLQQGFDTLLCPWDSSANLRTLGAAADTLQAMGMLATTWHHLAGYLHQIPEAAGCAWRGKAYTSHPAQITCVGALTRKVMPKGASYADAGWQSWEIEEGVRY